MSRIYLDNAATTPLCAPAAEAMAPYMQAGLDAPFGNANSVHSVGRTAFSALEDARMSVCHSLGAQRPDEIVFTSGATEADNAALVGLALAAREKARLKGRKIQGRVLMSRIEHDAILDAAKMLKALGFAVDFVHNDGNGFVNPQALEAALDEETVLVSIMTANNEVGTIQPIKDLAAAAHKHGALFHTDAVQALGKTSIRLREWNVDAASFSAHKVGGPKGVGVLYLKAATPFMPYLLGGGQERGLRSGTQNVAGIVGCAAAIKHAVENQDAFTERARVWRDALYQQLGAIKGVKPSVSVPSASQDFLPHIVNVCVRGHESQTLILQLDLRGICVSGGSACSSGSLGPSHVLTALGVERNLAQGSLRVSFGHETSNEDIHAFLEAFKEVVA